MNTQRFNFLKSLGFNPKLIIDIGAHVGEWNYHIKSIFPDAKIKSYEENPLCENYLKNANIDYKICLLGDKEVEQVDFYVNPNDLLSTGNSLYLELTTHFSDFKIFKLNMYTLDNQLKEDERKVDLLKLDVQGAELLILEGSKNTLKRTEFVLLEVNIVQYNKDSPLFAEVIKYMDDIGFIVFDIIEIHPYNNYLLQIDILFSRKDSNFNLKLG